MRHWCFVFLAMESRLTDRGPQRGDLPKIRFETTPRPIIPATDHNILSQELLETESKYSTSPCPIMVQPVSHETVAS